MRNKVEQNGLDWEVDSCGTAGYHIGESPDPRSIEKAKEYGIDISHLKGRQFHESDFDKFDLILVMDSENLKDIRSLIKDSEHRSKVRMIMDYAFPGKGVSVPDPYYGGPEGFENVYKMLDSACENIIQKHR